MDESLEALRRAAAGPWMRTARAEGKGEEWLRFFESLLAGPGSDGSGSSTGDLLSSTLAMVLLAVLAGLFLRRFRRAGRAEARNQGGAIWRLAASPGTAGGRASQVPRFSVLWIWVLAGCLAVQAGWIAVQRLARRAERELRVEDAGRGWNLLAAFARELRFDVRHGSLASVPAEGFGLVPDPDLLEGDPAGVERLERFVRRGGTVLLPIDFARQERVLGFLVPAPRHARRPVILQGDWLVPEEPEPSFGPSEIVFGDEGEGSAPVWSDEGRTPFLEHRLGRGLLVFVADRGIDWFSDAFLHRASHRVDRNPSLRGRVHLVARLLSRWAGPGKELVFLKSLGGEAPSAKDLVGRNGYEVWLAAVWLIVLFGLARPSCRDSFVPVGHGHAWDDDPRLSKRLGGSLLQAARVRMGLPPEARPGAVIEAVSRVTGMSRTAIRRIFFPSPRGASERRERWRRDYHELRRRLSR